jgi:hypothetical protein
MTLGEYRDGAEIHLQPVLVSHSVDRFLVKPPDLAELPSVADDQAARESTLIVRASRAYRKIFVARSREDDLIVTAGNDAQFRKLVEVQYERNDYDFKRGTFRVRGDVGIGARGDRALA